MIRPLSVSTVSSSSVSVCRNAPDPPSPPPPHALQQLAVQGAVRSSLQPQLPPHVLPMLYFPPASRQLSGSCVGSGAPRSLAVAWLQPVPARHWLPGCSTGRSLAARVEKRRSHWLPRPARAAAIGPAGSLRLLGDWASVNILVSFSACFPAAPLPPARADPGSPRTNELLRAAANWLLRSLPH